MTSPSTHSHIRQYLEHKNYFGLEKDQFTFVEQSTVPAVTNMQGEVDFDQETGYLKNKPFGHGESHLLMHNSGIAKKLKEQGFEWIVFMNDTNPLALRFLPSYIGISSQNDWEVAYICTKRKPGEAVGAICEVIQESGTSIITNVEYNVLSKLSVKKPEPVDADGYSLLPGNINLIIVSLKTYADNLEATGGIVSEFINPKVNEDGHTLKSPTRMETLISEYPYLLPDSKRIGAIQCQKLMCFSCAKNEVSLGLQKQASKMSLETCAACQFEYYDSNRLLLEKLGVKIGSEVEEYTYYGIHYKVGAKIILHPSFACTFRDLEKSVGEGVSISSKSMLEIRGKAILRNFELDGSLRITNPSSNPVSLDGKSFKTKEYITFPPVDPSQPIHYNDHIRGFKASNTENIINVVPDS